MDDNSLALTNVLHRYPLSGCEIAPLQKGHSNSQYRVRADQGHFVLRRYAHPGDCGWNRKIRSRQSILYEHEVLRYAASHGIPCVPPIFDKTGDTVVEANDRFHAAFPYVEGETYRREYSIGLQAAALLGRFHRIMRDSPVRSQRPHRGMKCLIESWFNTCEYGLSEPEQLVGWARTLKPQTDTQRYLAGSVDYVEEALRVLRHECPQCAVDASAVVVNHGDYYYANIGCRNDAIAVLYDFDDCSLDHPMLDLSHLVWRFSGDAGRRVDPGRARELVQAYRRENDISINDLTTFPFFLIANFLHIVLGLYGIVHLRPEPDLQWLTAVHMEIVKWHLVFREPMTTVLRGL